MTSQSALPQPSFSLHKLHSLLLQRIYHEDNILVQRTYALVTAHAFLAVALMTALSSDKVSIVFPYMLTYFGLFIAVIQLALGFRTLRTIEFWHKYTEYVEKGTLQLPLDSALGDFLHDNSFKLPIELSTSITATGPKMHDVFPWKIPQGATRLAGIWLPAALVAFWEVSLLTIGWPRLTVLAYGVIVDLGLQIAFPALIQLLSKVLSFGLHFVCGGCIAPIVVFGIVVCCWQQWDKMARINNR